MGVYTPNPANNPASITLPDDDENEDAASVDVPFEGLADKVAHANWPEQDATKTYPLKPRVKGYWSENCFEGVAEGNWSRTAQDNLIQTAAGAVRAVCRVKPPHNSTISIVAVRALGAAGHGALPATKPLVTLYKKDLSSGAVSIVASASDTAPDVPTFEGIHDILISGFTHLVDRESYRYFVAFDCEDGANSLTGDALFGCKIYTTVTEQDPAAGL